MNISQSAKDAADTIRRCTPRWMASYSPEWVVQKAIDQETAALRKTLVEAIAKRDELERQVQFMVDQGKMP
jgi:hypothetical protein